MGPTRSWRATASIRRERWYARIPQFFWTSFFVETLLRRELEEPISTVTSTNLRKIFRADLQDLISTEGSAQKPSNASDRRTTQLVGKFLPQIDIDWKISDLPP